MSCFPQRKRPVADIYEAEFSAAFAGGLYDQLSVLVIGRGVLEAATGLLHGTGIYPPEEGGNPTLA